MIPTALSPGATPLGFVPTTSKLRRRSFRVSATEAFPSFIPKQVEKIKDPFARKLAARIERLPVQVSFSEESIMSSCVKPLLQTNTMPVVLLHGFDSSCLEWRYTLPLLEEAGLETWAMDILGWGFSDLERLPSCDVASKRDHLYQFWKSYIKRPMLLVGPSLGAAVAIDFAVNHPEAVEKLVLLDASVYSESTSNMTTLPNAVAYAGECCRHCNSTLYKPLHWHDAVVCMVSDPGVYLLKSIPLRLYATYLAFNGLPFDTCIDWSNVGRLHCLLPWWEDATVAFMNSGGYNVVSQIERVKHRTLIIWGEEDQIISNKLAVRLHCELRNAIVRQVPDCGHIPHVEKPSVVANLIVGFSQDD